ncbi:Capsular glucan synthase [Aquisphaera giovannonii]|uniref:Capsular glucan synthase n=1 Tax=Aquisphaera giovannonii TaxID=406548 RepID=A0A5B9W1Y3_9BACT|nr:glycosyltransferase [Aquisphaera giovannonii]QEH34267.1 Capsular glucan synthase [Aquisphaera giovannonii]
MDKDEIVQAAAGESGHGCGSGPGSRPDAGGHPGGDTGPSRGYDAGVGRSVGSVAATEGETPGGGPRADRWWEPDRRLRIEHSELRSAYLALSREERALQAEARSMRERLASLEPGYAALVEQVGAFERGLGGLLLRKARGARRRIFREGRLSGRCWRLASRFAATLIASGPRVAVGKAAKKVRAKIRGPQPALDPEVRVAEAVPVEAIRVEAIRVEETPPAIREGFLDLPWRYLGAGAPGARGPGGHFKVLIVSHNGSRTGAPLCLLELAERLGRSPDFECWVVLRQGGELADDFARAAPTLDAEAMAGEGRDASEMPGLIARRFREFASRGVAICNTAEVSAFHAAFAEQRVPVLAWVHELSVCIAHIGGQATIDRIFAASRRVIVPADAVRDSLIARYSVDPDRLRTLYYGLEPRTLDLAQFRPMMRQQVRRELGIPEDAPIVLGCGTADFRKGTDLFAQLCRLVLLRSEAGEPSSDAWFVWLGSFGTAYSPMWLAHDGQHGPGMSRLIMAGPRDSTAAYFLAADLFALTSREDPCPFVNLEAMESGLAVVAFEDAGGAPEVLKEAGSCVPYLDVAAMADAVRALLNDPARRTAMGRRGQATIREHFTWDRFMEEFTEILRTDYDYHPSAPLKVSVIVPNYRHARYLERRLRGIFNQTLRPHEIIFLDNASPDDSVEVARRLAGESPVPMRIVVNEENNGSTFIQWMKGLSLATGDLVWIAEADDDCHPQLLERLVPGFYDPEVTLAYCQSAIIGPDDEVLEGDFLKYTDGLSPDRWRSPFCVPGNEEAELALSQINTIPNASAVVFRRPEGRPEFADELETMRFAGDWLFYAMQLRGGKITYVPQVLNLFRRHPQTNTHQVVRGDTYVEETLHVRARIMETYPLSIHSIASALARSAVEYDHLTREHQLDRPVFTANPRAQGPLRRIRDHLRRRHEASGRTGPGVLLVVGGLGPSGEAHAAIDLANSLAPDHRVYLCNARPWDYDPDVAARVADDVVRLEGTLGVGITTLAGDPPGAGTLSGQSARCKLLRELMRSHAIDVVHSFSRAADRLVLDIMDDLDLPWFTHLGDVTRDADFPILQHAARSAAGIFHEARADDGVTRQLSQPSGPRLIELPDPADPISLASVCSGAYARACEAGPGRPRESTSRTSRVA